MALCFQQEMGLVDDVLVDEQDILTPAPPDTKFFRDIPARETLLPGVCSSLLVFVDAYPTNNKISFVTYHVAGQAHTIHATLLDFESPIECYHIISCGAAGDIIRNG
ncbi:hypothetical protein AB3S75_028721 [Citrus x aurantiifolia]